MSPDWPRSPWVHKVKVETLHSQLKGILTSILIEHMDLSTLKSDIQLSIETMVNIIFLWINPHVYLIEVNNCILL